MAAEAGAPLLPTVIWGSQRVWTKDHPKRLGLTRVPIVVAVGETLPVPVDEDPVATTEQLRTDMERMLHEVQETYPDRPGPGEERWWVPARLGGGAPTPDEAVALDRDERRRRLAEAKAARDRRSAGK